MPPNQLTPEQRSHQTASIEYEVQFSRKPNEIDRETDEYKARYNRSLKSILDSEEIAWPPTHMSNVSTATLTNLRPSEFMNIARDMEKDIQDCIARDEEKARRRLEDKSSLRDKDDIKYTSKDQFPPTLEEVQSNFDKWQRVVSQADSHKG